MKIQALVQYIVVNLDVDLMMTVFYQMWAQLLMRYQMSFYSSFVNSPSIANHYSQNPPNYHSHSFWAVFEIHHCAHNLFCKSGLRKGKCLNCR